MSKKIILSIVALSISSAIVSPAMAYGFSDAFTSQNQARAGFYLRLPFAGGFKKTEKNQLSYGFAMGFGRSQAGSSIMDARRNFNADVIKLNFNAKGFKNFNIGGQDIYRINHTRLGAAEGESNMSNIWLGVAGAGLVVFGVVALSSKECHTEWHGDAGVQVCE